MIPFALNRLNLRTLPKDISAPDYPLAPRIGDPPAASIIHFGVGGFHRAHQARACDLLLRAGEGDWRICGVGLLAMDRKMKEALSSQDNLYVLVEQSPRSSRASVIGSICEYLLGPDDKNAVFERAASSEIKILSLTVTEKGYHYSTSRSSLQFDEEIMHDVERPGDPVTAPGYLVASLAERRRRGGVPVTILSCDNLPGNGDVARSAVCQLAERSDPALADWIRETVSFPNTMVDRITPVTTDENRAFVEERYGVADRWPVFCEEFFQWIIEDRFVAGRPKWEHAGAQFVEDVKPFELMKIRLLNGAHSALSYLALLAGYKLVDEAVTDEVIRGFLAAYMREIAATVAPPPGIELPVYMNTLLDRFASAAIRDRLARLAEDGSRKIQISIFAPLAELLARGLPYRCAAMAVAGWIVYLRESRAGSQTVVADPSNPLFDRWIAERGGTVDAFFAIDEVIPEGLRDNLEIRAIVRDFTMSLERDGVLVSLRRLA